jgi:hypothetical protein
MSGIKRANPAFVVSTNNTRVVPNRKQATKEEIENFKDDLRKKKDLEAKSDAFVKEDKKKKAKSEDKS